MAKKKNSKKEKSIGEQGGNYGTSSEKNDMHEKRGGAYGKIAPGDRFPRKGRLHLWGEHGKGKI